MTNNFSLITIHCKNCSQFQKGFCSNLEQLVSDNRPVCSAFTSRPCSECNFFDSSIPKDAFWGFCLSKGQYLSQPELQQGCQDFVLIVPYCPPSKVKRIKGDGSGYIQLHYHTSKKGKSYEQYYYHYEIWEGGKCLVKSSIYIPKAKLPLIQSLEGEKAPVTKIIKELGKQC